MCDFVENPKSFCEIYRLLSQHLSATNQTQQLTEQFRHLSTNWERVEFVARLLHDSGVRLDYRENLKNDEKSLKLRQSGNEAFKSKKLEESWEFYTKSIGFAVDNSENLSIAYANRSAVLYELQLYEECLSDIRRALDGKYPENLRAKLQIRAQNSNRQQSRKVSYEPLPTIGQRNPKIECAAISISIRSDQMSGRHVVADRDIEIGEILAIERPFTRLLVDKFYNHCHECLRICYNLIPCKYCPVTFYCGENCLQTAYKSYHQHECQLMATIKALKLDKLKLLPLKIVLLLKNLLANDIIGQQSEIYCSQRYNEIHNLITNCEKRPAADLFERALIAGILYDLIKKHSDFFVNESLTFEKQFKEVLLLQLQVAPSNFHEITELADHNGVFVPQEIDSGAYSFLSLLNHSCCPNVLRSCYGDTIVLRAIKSIKQGEQCFDNYGYHYALMDKRERQVALSSQYYFKCSCRACVEDWPKYEQLPQIEHLATIDEAIMSKLSQGDLVTALQILEDALDKLREAQRYMPCQNFCQLQEIVKQCYSIFGNKRFLF